MSWSRIQEILKNSDLKFDLLGWCPIEGHSSISHYESWIQKKYHGEMKYLENHLSIKKNPDEKYPQIRSVLSFAFGYLPSDPNFPFQKLNVARYARHPDYHFWIKDRLEKGIDCLRKEFPNEIFFPATDSSPLLERDLAYRAGLGWFGKNTCLIHPKKGSFFLLGEILTSLVLSDDLPEPTPDFCGTCTKCMDACPTEAFIEPRVLDAKKCISYGTIESRSIPDQEERKKWGSHFFGCDICQTVCPWNKKPLLQNILTHSKPQAEEDWLQHREQLIEELRIILTVSGKELGRKLKGTALLRAGPFGLRRNALIVAGNLKLKELSKEVRSYLPDERLGELASWCLHGLEET